MEYISAQKILSDYLWLGIVADNVDPKRRGRIKVRIDCIFVDLDTEDIPWASPFNDSAGKAFSVPAVGKVVTVMFFNDNIYQPYYIYSENYNINLRNILNSMSDDEYKNFIALAFDDRTQVYADDTNLTMDYKFNKITISNEAINLELKDDRQKLALGTISADQQVVLGNHWFEWMDKFIQTILQPTSLIGNLGAPVLKPQLDQLSAEYQSIRKSFVSNYVYVVDNNKVEKINRKTKTDVSKNDRFLTINDDPISKSTDVPGDIKKTIKENNQKGAEDIKSSLPIKLPDLPKSETPSNIDDMGYDLDAEIINI